MLLRVDFNVPVKNGKVLDDFRIQKALPTIEFLQKKGAKIILIAHLGKGGDSLLPIYNILNTYLKTKFVKEIIGANASKAVSEMKNGDVLLLENLRNNPGESGGNKIFAVELAKLADIYVNEAFSVDHRKDTSIVLLPKLLPSFVGLQLEKEVKNLSHALQPKHPFLFILGGAKFSTKMPLIKKYLKIADHIFIGGALANDFLKASGHEVGQSLTDEANYDLKKIVKNKKIIIPTDVIVLYSGKKSIKKVSEVGVKDYILDIGPETIKNLTPIISKSKLVLWNGPLGKYEDGGDKGTKEILKIIAQSKSESIIGGGDTVALISQMKSEKDFSFVSTGGGSTLDFLSSGTLPGIKALS